MILTRRILIIFRVVMSLLNGGEGDMPKSKIIFGLASVSLFLSFALMW